MDNTLKKNSFRIVGLVSLLVLFIALANCPITNVYAADTKEILVGGLLPFTGTNAAWGTRQDNGIRLMINKINREGGIKSLGGAKLKYVTADTESKPEIAQSQAEKLAAQGVKVVLGCNQSSSVITATQVLERKKIPLINANDFDPLITSRGFKYIFRTVPIMRDIANMLLIYAQEMNKEHKTNFRNVGILCEDSVTGDGAAKALAQYTKKIGYNLTDMVLYDATTTKDFTPVLSGFKAKGVDLFVGHNKPADSIQIVRNAKEVGFNPALLGGISGGWIAPEFPVNLGSLTENIIVSAQEDPGDTVGKFKEIKDEYFKLYKEEITSTAIQGVTAMWVLYTSLERAASTDTTAIAISIRKTDIKYGEGYYFQQFGCKFDENGDNLRAGASISQFKGGVRTVVFPDNSGKTKSIWPKPKFQ